MSTEANERIGLYPGTFDPITLGHADIIRRGSKLVDTLIVGVTTNPSKDPMFSPEERIDMVRNEVRRLGVENVVVEGFNALLVKYARKKGATVLIRGLRAVADFEYEYQMAGMNQQLDTSVETVFLMADVSLQPIASKLVKEIALFGGNVAPFVSAEVSKLIEARVATLGRRGDF
ncbi:pantetheine-phosphate adenylyltransferase [Croceibacterium aestuarii]|uniref:pantetheine-phosphate adenylyltransferase n=1 Tax=Croceibacterium aestuarii TaxID=3064139 RepID=UPI00272E5215|nr:pantetheine-phosphate adenylyltransferase [Croceibacterium sp. D39]